MIRIIARSENCGAVAMGGAANSDVTFQTFDVEIPEVETFLRSAQRYETRTILGVELLAEVRP